MPEQLPQTYANHRRFDPPFHFFAFGVFVLSFLYALWIAIRNPAVGTFLNLLFMAAILVLIFRVRVYSLKVQDRVIRLEERLRLASVLPDALRPRIGELSERQLIALRFASDGELSGLTLAALDERLGGEEIKKRIQSWRADTFRV